MDGCVPFISPNCEYTVVTQPSLVIWQLLTFIQYLSWTLWYIRQRRWL